MKKRIILPLTLLMAFSVKASDAPAPVAPDAVEIAAPAVADVTVAVAGEPAATVEAAPAVEPAPAPVVVDSVVVPAPVVVAPAPVAPAAPAALPSEDDINNLLALLSAYNQQSSVIRNLHDLAAIDGNAVVPVTADTVRSLLTLLELHKKEANLIASLRASLAAIQSVLGAWDGDVANLLNSKSKPTAKQKLTPKPAAARRDVDFGIVKDTASKPRPNN